MKSSISKTILCCLFFLFNSQNFIHAQNDIKSKNSSWYQTLDNTKTIYWPSAFGLKKGEHYYQNLYLVFHQIHWGITDNFSLGTGFELVTLLFGESSPIFSISPKYTEPINDKLSVGVGALILISSNFDNDVGAGVIYGLLSYGTKDRNLTIGLGHGNYGDTWSGFPQVNFGFNARIENNLGISGELWILDSGENDIFSFYSLGFKFIAKKFTLDLGLVNSFGDSNVSPLGGIVIPFGKSWKKNRSKRLF